MGIPYTQRRLPRRTFLYLSTSALVSLVATACGGSAATPTAQTTTSSSASSSSAASTSAAATISASSTSSAAAATTSAATSSAASGSATTSRAGSATASSSSSSSSASSSSAAAVPTKFQEAPALADQVKAGKLPPVEQRLPKEPMVIQPLESVGVYGGKWRSGYLGAADSAWFGRTIGYESLVRWDVEWKNLVPDIAKSYEVSPDGKEFTWHLREGMKWSDGQPFGSDDFVFWFEDVLANDELTPAKPAIFTTSGKLGKVVKIDDANFKMVFEQPNGLLLKRLAMLGNGTFIKPAHYAKQFHTKYNKEAVDKMVADQRLANWVALFGAKVSSVQNVGDARWFNPEMPTLFPWMLTTGIGQTNQVTAVRNPYYWKVDPQGNQLPYLDELDYPQIENGDVLLLKALNGEVEMEDRHFTNAKNKPVLTDNQQKGNYHFFTETPDSMNTFTVLFNFNHKDPVLRDIIRNKDFRVALSHAINRQQIIDTVYVSQGTPWQAAPLKASPYYHEQLATQYLEYDAAKANQMLDAIGLKKGSDGIRLRPDGKKLSMIWEVVSTSQDWIDVLNVLKPQWAAVGVDIQIKSEDRALRQTRLTALDHDVTNWGGDGGIDAILGPYWYMAYASFNCFASAWALWWETKGKQGEEPTAPAKKQQDLYDQIVITADPNKQKDLMKQLLDIAADQFWIMGISTPAEGYGMAKNNFHNVPKQMYSSGQEFVNPGASMPEQYYLK